MKIRHYHITSEISIIGNANPEARHVFIAEVDSGKALHDLSAKGITSGELSFFEREAALKEAVRDAIFDFLMARKILVPPFAATVDPEVLRGGTASDRQPDWHQNGIKLWHCGQSKSV